MFEREHHRRIATLLQALDAELLAQHGCLFGGGTAIVLLRDEYRESLDVDFMVSDLAGYRALRQLVTGPRGIRALMRDGVGLATAGDVRVDQYGIRTMCEVAGENVKFEIVLEGRVALEAPGDANQICGVATLTVLDMATTKLLANSDRWADDAVFSRDLIDLAMLAPPKATLTRAVAKAAKAYGESIERDLANAIERLKARSGRLDACMTALKLHAVPKALLWKLIRSLKPR